MAHASCPNGHGMWDGDGKPIVWAFRVGLQLKRQICFDSCISNGLTRKTKRGGSLLWYPAWMKNLKLAEYNKIIMRVFFNILNILLFAKLHKVNILDPSHCHKAGGCTPFARKFHQKSPRK